MNILEKSGKLEQKTQCQHGTWYINFTTFPFANDANRCNHSTQITNICYMYMYMLYVTCSYLNKRSVNYFQAIIFALLSSATIK